VETLKIKKNDKVVIITGKDKDKDGKILKVDRKNSRVIVEGRNFVSKHKKPDKDNQNGGIIKMENYVDMSNVMYLHKGKPTRIGFRIEIKEEDGKSRRIVHRVAKSTGEDID
jgi:large subunit ribosomal protein L24